MRLKPNDVQGNKEWFDEYYVRISKKHEFSNIPNDVFKQWIHAHHDEYFTLRNYAWLDYEKMRFDLVQWETSAFLNIYVIESFREWVSGRAGLKDISQFGCTKEDLSTWEEKGTWKTPPIILDVTTLNMEVPEWSELHPPFQLVEGHTRFGYLQSMMHQAKNGKTSLASHHSIYLMREEKQN